MTNLKKRERAKTNASLISMVQRFSDITIMFAGLWLVCEVSGLSFLYMHLLVALITLVVFQMLGGITDFYRSWRGVRAATEFALLLQNWTLSVILSAGLVAFNNDFDTQLKIWLAWYRKDGWTRNRSETQKGTEKNSGNLPGVVWADQHRTGGLPFMYSYWCGLAA